MYLQLVLKEKEVGISVIGLWFPCPRLISLESFQ